MPLDRTLDLDNIEHTDPEEIEGRLASVWAWRGPLYEMYASSLPLDYAPDFAKLTRWASDIFGRPAGQENVILQSCQNIHSYMMYGWETGLRNEFETLWRNGMSKEQILELVFFSNLYAGMRGLGHVYHAVGDLLPSWGPPPTTPIFPEGWDPDPDAFKSGLDLSTREFTSADRTNLTNWYETTIGYLPKSVQFAMEHNPKFLKLNRARLEVTLKTVPKQLAPYLMLRHNTITGSEEGLRESTLLGKAWGFTADQVVRAIANTAMYFTGFEGLQAFKAVDDILDHWND